MIFYHVTTAASAKKILKEGLKPRCETRKKTVYGAHMPSISSCVYLASRKKAEAIMVCLQKKDIRRKFVLLAVEVDDTENLRPDEDWFGLMCSLPFERFVELALEQDYEVVTDETWSFGRFPRQVYSGTEVRGHYGSYHFRLAHSGFTMNYCYSFLTKTERQKMDILNITKDEWMECFRQIETVAHKGAIPPSRISIVNL